MDPVACGRFGVRSPARYGIRSSPSAPGGTAAARPSASSRSRPTMAETESTTRVQLSMQTSGRKRPVASAKPSTSPVSSMMGSTLTANAVPLVPRLTTSSPGAAPTPSAAAMLSPVPGPTGIPGWQPERRRGVVTQRAGGLIRSVHLRQVAVAPPSPPRPRAPADRAARGRPVATTSRSQTPRPGQ